MFFSAQTFDWQVRFHFFKWMLIYKFPEVTWLLKPISVSTGDLFVVGPGRIEMKYTTIDLTDDLKKMNGSIIECRYVDHHWIFVRLRNDRKHPNGRRTVIGTET